MKKKAKKTQRKTLGQIGYDATPEHGGKSNFGPWEKAPEIVRRIHEDMAKAVAEVAVERYIATRLEASRRTLSEKMAGLQYCLEKMADEDALEHLFDLIRAVRVRAAFRGMRPQDLTWCGQVALDMIKPEGREGD